MFRFLISEIRHGSTVLLNVIRVLLDLSVPLTFIVYVYSRKSIKVNLAALQIFIQNNLCQYEERIALEIGFKNCYFKFI